MRSAVLPKTWRRSCASTWVSLAVLVAAAFLPAATAAYTAQEARKLAGELKNDGVHAYQTGHVSTAVEKLSAAIDINLNDFFAHFYLGLALRDLRRYREARQVLEVTTQLDPRYLPVYVALGDVALGLGNPDEARTWFQTALNRQDTYSPALDGMGRLAEALGDDDGAIDTYRRAIDANRGFPDPYVHLGALYHRKNRLDDAITLFQEAIHFQPGFAKGYLNLGVAYGRLGRRTEAVSLLEKASELKPEDPEPHIALGDLLATWDERVQARAEYETARHLGPERFEPLRGLAGLARRQGDYPAADALLDQALALPGLGDGTRTELLAAQTTYRSEARRAESADRRLALAQAAAAGGSDAAEAEPTGATATEELGWSWLELARLRHDAGDLSGALAACREALEPLARPVDLVAECGYFALQARDWGPARELLDEAATRDPTDAHHLINLALAYTGLGRISSSVETLQRALAVDARSPEATTYLGNAYYRLGKLDEAEASYRAALTLVRSQADIDRLQEVLAHLDEERLQGEAAAAAGLATAAPDASRPDDKTGNGDRKGRKNGAGKNGS